MADVVASDYLTLLNQMSVVARAIPYVEIDELVLRVGPAALAHGWHLWQSFDDRVEFVLLSQLPRRSKSVTATRELLEDVVSLDRFFESLGVR